MLHQPGSGARFLNHGNGDFPILRERFGIAEGGFFLVLLDMCFNSAISLGLGIAPSSRTAWTLDGMYRKALPKGGAERERCLTSSVFGTWVRFVIAHGLDFE